MRAHRFQLAGQRPATTAQQPDSDAYAALGTPKSPYVTVAEVAAFIRADRTKHPQLNAWRFINRHGIATEKIGRELLVYKTSLIDALAEIGRKARARRRADAAKQGLKVVSRSER